MKWLAPDYYPRFACIGGRCRHSCCIGWEIDIDPESLARYQAEDGPFGERLRQGIRDGSFRMDEGGRCAFLNPDGLCEMILHLGEESLCHICADHPRFRNHFSHCTELGLGLCCEEAARLIVFHQPPTRLILLEEDGTADAPTAEEKAFLSRRDYLLALLQKRQLSIPERLRRALALWGAREDTTSPAQWANRLSGLERLEEGWLQSLRLLSMAPDGEAAWMHHPQWETAFEQLAVYFCYRHLAGALQDGRYRQRLAFCAVSVQILRRMCIGRRAAYGECTLAHLAELARQYSSELEYSEDNLQAMLGWCDGRKKPSEKTGFADRLSRKSSD